MGEPQIELLDHRVRDVASRIHALFQRAYAVEARLVGAAVFPPLQRKASAIQTTRGHFLGSWIGSDLVSVLEYTDSGRHVSIDSLVVDPHYFRRGLAGNILQFLFDESAWLSADVETAAANRPAIALYEKFGFVTSKQWTTAEGIAIVRLKALFT
jgi:GNAT superfamily N-acetyltransferase